MQINIVKLGSLILVLVGIILGAYSYGYSEAKEAERLVQLEKLKVANEQAEKLREKLSEASRALSEKESEVKLVEKEVTRDVIKYIKVPDRSVCNLDDEWLRIRQRILEAADTRNQPTE